MIAMGTDVLVATDVMLDYCQLHVVVGEHGHSEVNSITIDFLLGLPSWIFCAQWHPVHVFNSLVLAS